MEISYTSSSILIAESSSSSFEDSRNTAAIENFFYITVEFFLCKIRFFEEVQFFYFCRCFSECCVKTKGYDLFLIVQYNNDRTKHKRREFSYNRSM